MKQIAIVQAVWNDIKTGHKLRRIGGLAGTGKSTLLVGLRNLMISKGMSVITCAVYGTAVKNLKKRGVEDAVTLHKLLYDFIGTETRTKKVLQQDGTFVDVWDGETPIFKSARIGRVADVLLVDEGSTVTEDNFDKMMATGMTVIVLGDHGQLPPVGDNFNLMENPDYELDTIFRNAGAIAEYGYHLRSNPVPPLWPGIDTRKVITVPELMKYDQIISGLRDTRININNEIRRLQGKKKKIEIGDRIISLKNNDDLGICNGTQATVVGVVSERSRLYVIELEPGSRMQIKIAHCGLGVKNLPKKRDKGHLFDYAWCMTCHKALGGEWDNVAVIDEAQKTCWNEPGLDRRWRYTAATRAKKKLLWAANVHIPIDESKTITESWTGKPVFEAP